MQPVIIMTAELVHLAGDGSFAGHVLDMNACAILSRLLFSPCSRGILIPDTAWPPYTHVLVFRSATFRVTVSELSPEEAAAVGLDRSVTMEEAAVVLKGPRPLVRAVAFAMTPGEAIQDAIDRGMPGWKFVPS